MKRQGVLPLDAVYAPPRRRGDRWHEEPAYDAFGENARRELERWLEQQTTEARFELRRQELSEESARRGDWVYLPRGIYDRRLCTDETCAQARERGLC